MISNAVPRICSGWPLICERTSTGKAWFDHAVRRASQPPAVAIKPPNGGEGVTGLPVAPLGVPILRHRARALARVFFCPCGALFPYLD
ncbi:hypothetical protein XAP7430_770049 [Xanthomonas phaseoli pv. phaseoli]|uniref:Uncharacterized protein n=1 Tax=Xanthomonas campestris pv. phaseoli TaxID=317013 RepID=A0AB38E4I2_XANCH|nr:hypothetical protein XAP6984_810049 [Xanthomonas phaseoli pv. phaseoli]SON92491.1 hypothetical protein XAP7430_770049 [Xanthomonas phaseoli pv. phaseoli]